MTEFTTTTTGDRVAYDLRGTGPALIFVAGAGPFRAIDPWTTETAERAAQQGITTLVFDRLGRGESPAEGRLDLDRELDAIQAMLDVVGGSAALCGHSSGCSISLRAAAAGLPVDGLALWEAPLAGAAADTRAWWEDGGLGGIRKPVLAMYGTETFPEMPVAAARIVEAIPDAIEKAVPGSKHTWQPEPMAAELSAFVKSCQQPTSAPATTPIRH
jgi:pimeloyl-ACP methyl ester carboxylesterase